MEWWQIGIVGAVVWIFAGYVTVWLCSKFDPDDLGDGERIESTVLLWPIPLLILVMYVWPKAISRKAKK